MDSYTPKTVKDVPADSFIREYAAHLKASGKMELPEWVDIVKTGYWKELAPLEEDWYYTRAAAVARKLYFRQNLGVGLLSKKFGGRNKAKRGTRREKFAKSAGGVIRHVLQQLEKMGLVETVEEDVKGGRKITNSGQRDMDLIAGRIQVEYAL